jgi:hypothetical protein
LDDYLAAGHSVDDLLALASAELRRPPADPDDEPGPYVVSESGTLWRKPTRDGTVDVLLANFSATIADDVVEDDGAEERRVYGLEAALRGGRYRIDIPAHQFNAMNWVGERLGASAVLEPGMGTRERFRHAIQTLSGDVPQRRVFAHTGWRLIDDAWIYLHGAGAIGPDGPHSDVSVALRGPLSRFVLPELPASNGLIAPLQAAVRLLDLLPPEVAYPLLGATWLAPLRELLADETPDFVLWVHGPSGTFKSELLALAQSFYGDFTRQTLPTNFSATANALERFLFEAKDALLAVDDYHPAGDLREQQAMNQVANRLLRGAGNAAGRARMRADTTLRPALTPRGLAIASGERLPDGHSSIARMFPVSVTPGAIEPSHLTAAQEQRHLYPLAMAGYLQVLAQQFAQLRAALPGHFRALRTELQVSGGHRREPGQLAHLLLGLETFLDFAVGRGVITAEAREMHLWQARAVLVEQARDHARAQAEEAPERLFLRYLGDGLAGKKAYLTAKSGGVPSDPELWGWERGPGHDDGLASETWRHPVTAQLLGVLDEEWALLFPEQVYQFVVGAARAAGRTFPVDQNSLIRRLDEAGLIAVEIAGGERRRKVNAWIGSATKRVVKLRRNAVVRTSSGKDREEREGREDPVDFRAVQDIASSRATGNESATGKSLPKEEHAREPNLPDHPGLPSFNEEGEAAATQREDLVEWSG